MVFAAQHYASQLALPTSQRHRSVLPASRKDVASKAFEKLVRPVLPASHGQLARAIEREARDYRTQLAALDQAAREPQEPANGQDEDLDERPDGDEVHGEDLEERLGERGQRGGPRRAAGRLTATDSERPGQGCPGRSVARTATATAPSGPGRAGRRGGVRAVPPGCPPAGQSATPAGRRFAVA